MAEWIGMAEARKILGLSGNTVKKLVRKGILTAYEVTGVRGLQFHREDVEKLIKKVEPTEANSKRQSQKRKK